MFIIGIPPLCIGMFVYAVSYIATQEEPRPAIDSTYAPPIYYCTEIEDGVAVCAPEIPQGRVTVGRCDVYPDLEVCNDT